MTEVMNRYQSAFTCHPSTQHLVDSRFSGTRGQHIRTLKPHDPNHNPYRIFNMNLTLFAAALLPALALSAAVGEVDPRAPFPELPEVDIDQLDGNYEIASTYEPHDKRNHFYDLFCVPERPRICLKHKFCCPKGTIGCCRADCCAKGAVHCGYLDGRCYKPTSKRV